MIFIPFFLRIVFYYITATGFCILFSEKKIKKISTGIIRKYRGVTYTVKLLIYNSLYGDC